MESTSSPVYMVTKDDLYQVVKTLCDEYLAEKQTETVDKLISVKEAVFLLNVDRSTLWHWEKRNFLLPVRIGRKVYYRMADIKKLQGGAQ